MSHRDDFRRDYDRRERREEYGPPGGYRERSPPRRDYREEHRGAPPAYERGYDHERGYDRGPAGYDRGPGGYDRGPAGYDRGPAGYERHDRGYDRGYREEPRGPPPMRSPPRERPSYGRAGPPGPPPVDRDAVKGSGCLFVGNLPYHFRERELRDIMEASGEIVDCTIGENRRTGQSKGHAFVQFRDPRDAQDAYRRFQGFNIDGRALRIDWDPGLRNKGRPARRGPPPARDAARYRPYDGPRDGSAPRGRRSPPAPRSPRSAEASPVRPASPAAPRSPRSAEPSPARAAEDEPMAEAEAEGQEGGAEAPAPAAE